MFASFGNTAQDIPQEHPLHPVIIYVIVLATMFKNCSMDEKPT